MAMSGHNRQSASYNYKLDDSSNMAVTSNVQYGGEKTASELIITAKDLVVKFGDKTAVDHVNLAVKKGEVYGLLGPNGAGKTTTIRILTTLRRPDSGRVVIDGLEQPSGNREIRKKIGIVQQVVSLDKDISVRENMICHGILHKVPISEVRDRIAKLSEALGLEPFLDYTVVQLSGGWQRKTAIACSLIHNPQILFLDEPTAGLDTQSRHMLWDMIRQLNKSGVTVFLTTHYIEEAESLCGCVTILNGGKVAAVGNPTDLCDDLGKFAVEYDIDGGIKAYRFFKEWAEAKAFAAEVDEGSMPLLRKTTLEDVFLEITGRKTITNFVKVVRI